MDCIFFDEIVKQLDAWSNEAAFRPVFEFYADLLARDGVQIELVQ